jgi:glycerophosphoryl diester phosphodiesterase
MKIRNMLCCLLWTGSIGQGIAQNQAPTQVDTTASTQMVVKIMKAARDHALAHGDKYSPAISPSEQLLLGDRPAIDIAAFRSGIEAPVIV